MRREDLTGANFGRLSVVGFFGVSLGRKSMWNCNCECGKKIVVRANDLKRGATKSCGCSFGGSFGRSNAHSVSYEDRRFYGQWTAMNERCKNKSCERYDRYGGRGIVVMWKSFEEYKKDMFEKYIDHVKKHGSSDTFIERIDNNGNYCKENCTFATLVQQARNKSNNKLFTYKGETKCISEWSEKIGIPFAALYLRLTRYKWDIEKALTTTLLN